MRNQSFVSSVFRSLIDFTPHAVLVVLRGFPLRVVPPPSVGHSLVLNGLFFLFVFDFLASVMLVIAVMLLSALLELGLSKGVVVLA